MPHELYQTDTCLISIQRFGVRLQTGSQGGGVNIAGKVKNLFMVTSAREALSHQHMPQGCTLTNREDHLFITKREEDRIHSPVAHRRLHRPDDYTYHRLLHYGPQNQTEYNE